MLNLMGDVTARSEQIQVQYLFHVHSTDFQSVLLSGIFVYDLLQVDGAVSIAQTLVFASFLNTTYLNQSCLQGTTGFKVKWIFFSLDKRDRNTACWKKSHFIYGIYVPNNVKALVKMVVTTKKMLASAFQRHSMAVEPIFFEYTVLLIYISNPYIHASTVENTLSRICFVFAGELQHPVVTSFRNWVD